MKNIRRREIKDILKQKNSYIIFSNPEIKVFLFKKKTKTRFSIHFVFFKKIFNKAHLRHKEMRYIKDELKELRKDFYGYGTLILAKKAFFYKDKKYNKWKECIISRINELNLQTN